MNPHNRIARAAVAAALAGMTSASYAGGFGIATQNGSGTGNAFAGGAAVVERRFDLLRRQNDERTMRLCDGFARAFRYDVERR